MRCLAAASLVLASGCQLLFGLDDSKPRTDGASGTCYGTEIEVCFDEPPSQTVALTGPINTGSQTGAGASADCLDYHGRSAGLYCVVAGKELGIPMGATVAVTGSRPLVLIADDGLTIAGTLDAAAHATPRLQGPGADVAMCDACMAAPGTQGGGTGGSFGEGGAIGGTSGSDLGGGLCPIPDASMFRAGCAGQNGGGSDATTGLGGGAGGAVYLLARTAIDITGTAVVDTSGAGGVGGRCTTCNGSGGSAFGGGGGGSGGTIVIESPVINVIGRVFADGGGGGEGASHATNGLIGGDPDGNTAALGGNNSDPMFHGGGGGAGGHAAIGPVIGDPGTADPPGGGGGGGGSVGIIHVIGTISGATSPPPS